MNNIFNNFNSSLNQLAAQTPQTPQPPQPLQYYIPPMQMLQPIQPIYQPPMQPSMQPPMQPPIQPHPIKDILVFKFNEYMTNTHRKYIPKDRHYIYDINIESYEINKIDSIYVVFDISLSNILIPYNIFTQSNPLFIGALYNFNPYFEVNFKFPVQYDYSITYKFGTLPQEYNNITEINSNYNNKNFKYYSGRIFSS